MRKQFLKVKVGILLLLISTILKAQQPSSNDVGKAVGIFATQISNSTKELKTAKLQRQQFSISKLHEALSNLENDKLIEAYSKGEEAMVSFPKYSLSYLIMAYVALQKGDFLNSNRLLNLYSKYAKKRYNKDLAINVPKEFIDIVKANSDKGIAKLSSQDLKKQYRNEPWLNNSLELQLLPSALIVSDGAVGYINSNGNTPITDFPEFVSDNNISLIYKKYLWLNKKNSLPYSNNNIGICFNVGVDLNLIYPKDYFPLNYKFFVTPGLFIHKIYLSPGQFRYYKISNYSQEYTGYSGNSYPSLGFLLNPEIRWYPGVLNAYATDMTKLSREIKSSAKFSFGYLFLKLQQDFISGANSKNETYSRERDALLFGFSGFAGKNRTTEFGCFFGPGSINHIDQDNATTTKSISGDYWKVGFTISKRIF